MHGRQLNTSSRSFRPLVRISLLALNAWLVGGSVVEAADETGPPGPAPPPAVPAFRQAERVAVLTIRGEIDLLTLHSLERRIRAAVKSGARAIALDIDTLGGRMDATLDICNLLKDRSVTPPNTVAWIHPQAYSAGAIIALACREIVVVPNATLGDAAPIHAMPLVGLIQMAPAERAKIEAPILAEVIDSARRNHYDENLVQSFVSVGIELWLIEDVETGARIVVDRPEYLAVMEADPPDQITSVTPPAVSAAAPPPLTPRFRSLLPAPPPEASPPVDTASIRDEIERQQQLPPSRAPLTAADRGRWRLVSQVISSDRLLTVKSAEAVHYGLATTTVANDDQLRRFFGAGSLDRLDQSWSESLVRFLVSMPVRIVLIVIFLLALFIELAAPGVGVFGGAAAVALLALMGAPYLAGMAQWWDILLIAVGILLIAVEILVIPGFGVSGVAGALCLLAGLVGTFITADLSSSEGKDELGTGLVSILTALFMAIVGMWLISRHLRSFPMISRLALDAELSTPSSRAAQAGGLLAAMGSAQRALEEGEIGVAATDLRPSGRGSFAGRIVDVQAPGQFVERGSKIRVTAVDRYVIEVEESQS